MGRIDKLCDGTAELETTFHALYAQAMRTLSSPNPSTNALTRNAFSVTPWADNGPSLPNPGGYFWVPYPIANVSGGGFSTLSEIPSASSSARSA